MKVMICSWDELSEEAQERWRKCEDSNFLIVTDNAGHVLRLETDSMEPEDASFYRDLSWVKDAIEQAYQLGLQSSTPVNEWAV